MNELLKKIFDNVISQKEDAIKIFKYVDDEINKIIEPYKVKFSIVDRKYNIIPSFCIMSYYSTTNG